ncbi:MAG: leucyl/phenylalanyl-tRNA--protein transferase [Bradymonadia bacterium]|jgi:leucyl/phenylalanyl-tRNA--protein transferase
MVHLLVMPIYALNDEPVFPDPIEAEPDGLLAVGGDLAPRRVLTAYALGIFPWPIGDMPLAWFSPPERMLLDFDDLKISRSLRKALRSGGFSVTMDQAFPDVMAACCSTPRSHETGTWITDDMQRSYAQIHELGFAHSVEVWREGELVGGLYGISIGAMFCGESMFHTVNDASKIAFVALARQLQTWGFHFLDCQLHTPHLESLGAFEIPREEFRKRLQDAIWQESRRGQWSFELELPTLGQAQGA